MSAHVVAKPKAFSENDEEERTTLESSWEEEPSTTVEEGDAADRIRELSGGPPKRPNGFGASFTSTTGSRLEEPTVDDQHMPQGLLLSLPVSRLVVIGGNDTGQELEVKPGKSYTIGRAIGNDIVLTDIAVSRQHFDLRNADGSWVLVDRGSGNGTVVNGNIEDNPFMLANGDVIEIGNTQFRFDLPNGAPRANETMDVSVIEEVVESDIDAEEMSTVVGKPLRSDQVEKTEIDAQPYTGARPYSGAPASLPAPLPAPLSRPPDRARGPSSGPLAPLSGMPSSGSSMPTSPIAVQAPLPAPGRGPAIGSQAPTMLAQPALARPGMAATTLPGQGMMSPSAPQQVSPAALYGYPNGSDLPPQNVARNAQMLVISQQGRRNDASTQHVAPISYGMRPSGQRAAFAPAKLSQRARLIVAGIGLTLFAMVITVAVIRSGGNASTVAAGSSEAPPPAAPPPSAPPVVAPNPPAVDPPKPPSVAVITPPAVDPPKPAAVAPPTTAPQKVVVVDPPKPVVIPPKPAVDPHKPAPVENKRVARQNQPTPKRQPEPRSEPKRVAAVDISSYKAKADELYHAKRFNDAAQAARSGIRVASDDDAHALKSIAALYEQLGRWYSTGMAASTRPTDAFAALRKAENLDRSAGGALTDDIHARLSSVSPKAAVAFYVVKDYENAYTAVRTSESLGAANGTVKTVREKLEILAGTLYGEAAKSIDSSPDQAKDKLRRIQKMVDAKNQWYVKAQKLLGG